MSWPHVDYDTDLWMKIPDVWETTPWKGPKQWARHMSEAWRGDSDLDPTRKDLKGLAATLQACAEQFPGSHPGFDVYLHLPDPRLMALPVYVGAFEAGGDREKTLRALVTTEDPYVVENPVVEDFTTDLLGTGLRALRYTQTEEGRTIVAGVRYAWRVEEAGCDVLAVVAAPDPRRVLGAMDDVDAFAGRISVLV